MSKDRAPANIIRLLEEALRANTMERAHFDRPGEHFSPDAYTEEVREATRIYRDTWIACPLETALAYLRGDITAAQALYDWEL